MALHQFKPSSGASPYLASYAPRTSQISLRLICFPFAGAGTAVFAPWSKLLPPDVEVIGFRLPGRELRALEAPVSRLQDHLEPLRSELISCFDRPVAFFGHSMGALLAFEVAQVLQFNNGVCPIHLFVSGAKPPSMRGEIPQYEEMTQAELISLLRTYDGTPAEVLDNPELLDIVLPSLRADLVSVRNYSCQWLEPLSCPITAIGGEEDPHVDAKDLADWNSFTRAEFAMQILPGDHFFLKSHCAELISYLRERLAPWILLHP
jgi:medium-chain acyl-[acyl-carrier-protein] hydrolase